MSLSDQIKQPGQIIGGGDGVGGGATTDLADWPAGLSEVELGYVNGVTSAIQTQLDGKAASSHTHAASDLTTGQVALARGGTNADLSATGGTGHVLKQSSAGAAITVGALTASDIPSTLNATTFSNNAGATSYFLSPQFLLNQGNRLFGQGEGDTSWSNFAGGSAGSQANGAFIRPYGNSHATKPGITEYYTGNASGAKHQFFDKNGVEKFRVDETGSYSPTYGYALLGFSSGGSNYQLKLGGGANNVGINSVAAGAEYHTVSSGYPYANIQSAPLITRAASTAIALCPVATGDMAYVTILESSIASCKVKVDTAGTVTFTDLDGNAASASIVNSSSPAAAEYGVYISAGVLYFKGGSSYAGKMSSFSQIGKA